MERLKSEMMAGKAKAEANPWAVDYNQELEKKSGGKEVETLVDKAKSFSF